MNIDKPRKALIVYITVQYKPGYSTGIITLHIIYCIVHIIMMMYVCRV